MKLKKPGAIVARKEGELMKNISLACKDPGKWFHDCKDCKHYDSCDYFQKFEKRSEEIKKRRYVKPEIKKVPLRPQEAVLGFCKTSQMRGPRFGTCTRPGMCMTEGS